MSNYIFYSVLILMSLVILTNVYIIKCNIIEARKDIDEIKRMKKNVDRIAEKIRQPVQRTIQHSVKRQVEPSVQQKQYDNMVEGRNIFTEREKEEATIQKVFEVSKGNKVEVSSNYISMDSPDNIQEMEIIIKK